MGNVDTMLAKIEKKEVVVGVIGLGYVGLPLAVTFARKGVTVLGFEKWDKRAAQVNEARNYILGVHEQERAESGRAHGAICRIRT